MKSLVPLDPSVQPSLVLHAEPELLTHLWKSFSSLAPLMPRVPEEPLRSLRNSWGKVLFSFILPPSERSLQLIFPCHSQFSHNGPYPNVLGNFNWWARLSPCVPKDLSLLKCCWAYMPQSFSQANCLQRPVFFWFVLAPIRSFGQSCSVTIIPDRFAQSAKFQTIFESASVALCGNKETESKFGLGQREKVKENKFMWIILGFLPHFNQNWQNVLREGPRQDIFLTTWNLAVICYTMFCSMETGFLRHVNTTTIPSLHDL